MSEQKDAYVEELKVKIDEWGAEIDKIQAKVEAGARWRKQIVELKARRHVLGEKIEELQKAGEKTWDEAKTRVDVARKALADAIETANSRPH